MAKKLTISEMCELAVVRRGKCLSDVYKNQNTKLKWQCGICENVWEATYASVSIGGWCPQCGVERSRRAKIKYSINDMRNIANSRGGECLSDEYLSALTKLTWRCSKGHEWSAVPVTVVRGTWCKVCAYEKSGATQRLSIGWFKEYALNRGGRCHSDSYKNAQSRLNFECKKGHKWDAMASNIRQGTWCPVCGGSHPLSLEGFKAIARERGGECLSKTYINQRQKLKFRCENGHVFEKHPGNFKNKLQWCPECSQNIGERICKVAFESIFSAKFPCVWPDWLRTSEGQPMELDGYNVELNIAFEHQGEQHYSTKTHWIKSDKELEKRQKVDRRKYYLARKHGVHLFRIPQVPQRVPAERLIPYIVNKAMMRGISVPDGWESLEIDYRSVFHGHGDERILSCQALAVNKNGKFLSTTWEGEEAKYTWECAEGHQWKTKVRYIIRGNWCAECSGKSKNTIEDIRTIAETRGGECLSHVYISAHKKLKFKCEHNHTFYSSGSNVKNLGRWCPECSGKKRLTLQEMQKIASARGGECLSDHYINNKTKLLWKCNVGHQWEAVPKKIKIGQWCPICGRNRIAKKRLD